MTAKLGDGGKRAVTVNNETYWYLRELASVEREIYPHKFLEKLVAREYKARTKEVSRAQQ